MIGLVIKRERGYLLVERDRRAVPQPLKFYGPLLRVTGGS